MTAKWQYREAYEAALITARDLRAENEGLRELARCMWPYVKSYLDMLPELGINDTESFDIYLKMRELGIEVDDD